ncbi:MAG: hypothetical protein AAF490_03105 [Chloroflexota bacterium]
MSLNRIAFVDFDGRVNTISPDGTDQRVLTGKRRIFQFPAWSPINEQIAAVGNNDNGGGLYVISDQQQQTLVTPELYFSHNQFPFYQYWSPDGQSVSFLTTHPLGFGLRIAYLTGKNYLLMTGQPLFWTWGNEPKKLFVHSGEPDSDARLAFIGTDGDGFGENIARPGFFQTPGISKNGRFMAFAELDSFGKRHLVVEDILEKDAQRFNQKGMMALTWNPSLSLLATISTDTVDQRPYGPLNIIDPVQKQTKTVINKNVLAFFWSPDGQKIAYLLLPSVIKSDEQTSGYQPTKGMYTNGVVPFTLSMPTEEPHLAVELRVFDLKKNEDRFLMKCSPPTTFLNQYLPFFDQYALSHRLWSPDSQHIVLPHLQEETAVLQISSLDGQLQTVVEGLMPSWSHF